MMVVISVTKTYARALPSVQAVVLISPYENIDYGLSAMPYEPAAITYEHHIRQRREAYDPYGAYYYYPKSLNTANRYETAKSSLVNRRQAEDDLITQDGNKYKYTPLFQYKSTQSKRRKLFVPNLFG